MPQMLLKELYRTRNILLMIHC